MSGPHVKNMILYTIPPFTDAFGLCKFSLNLPLTKYAPNIKIFSYHHHQNFETVTDINLGFAIAAVLILPDPNDNEFNITFRCEHLTGPSGIQ